MSDDNNISCAAVSALTLHRAPGEQLDAGFGPVELEQVRRALTQVGNLAWKLMHPVQRRYCLRRVKGKQVGSNLIREVAQDRLASSEVAQQMVDTSSTTEAATACYYTS